MNSSQTIQPITQAPSIVSIILLGVGILSLIISTFVHFGILSSGPSGQLVVDMLKKSSLWGVLAGIIILFVGIVIYRLTYANSTSFIWMFVLAWTAYFLANLSIMFSLFQVEISPN